MKCQICGKEFSAKVYEIHVKDCKVVKVEKTEVVKTPNKGGRPRK